MTFWLGVLFVLLAAWVARRFSDTDRDLARLAREVQELRSQLRLLQEERARPSEKPPAAVPAPPPPPLPPRAAVAPPLSQSTTLAGRGALPADDEDAGVVERAIGERWFLYAGVILLLLAVVFFLRYAFERNWLSPAVRVASGCITGLMLIVGGRQLSASGYRNYGLSLAGAGFVVLYLSIYAALNFYGLLSPVVAFALLFVVSAGAAWLADMEVSPPLAVVAVAGGFATPFLVGGHEDAQLVLFTYDALLIAATTFLALRRRWWYLNVLALGLTVMTVGAWAAEYYVPAKALRTELFLTLYCTMFLVILRASLGSASRRARHGVHALVAAPVLYHFASVAILYARPEAFLAYLILASTASLVIAERADLPSLRALAWLAVTVPLAEWVDEYRTHLAASVVTIVAVYAAYLAAEIQALHTKRWHPTIDTLLNDANGLAVYAELYIAISGRVSGHLALIATGMAVWNAAIAAFVWRWDWDRALHWLAVAATLLAIAIAIAFEGPWVVVMWGVEGAALLAIGIYTGHGPARAGGWVLLVIAVLRWTGFDVQRTDIATMAVLNARTLSGLLLVGLLYGLAVFEGAAADRDDMRRWQRAALFVSGSALAVGVVSREIDVYWALQAARGEFTDIIRQAMLSAAWALSAAIAITVGIRRHYRPIRYFAIALFAVTIAKVLLVDLDTLAGIDRIIAFLVVGVVLLFASFLYQRSTASRRAN